MTWLWALAWVFFLLSYVVLMWMLHQEAQKLQEARELVDAMEWLRYLSDSR
jgi:hypothetical protein